VIQLDEFEVRVGDVTKGNIGVCLMLKLILTNEEFELGLGRFLVFAEPMKLAADRAGVLIVAGRPVEFGDAASHVILRPCTWLPSLSSPASSRSSVSPTSKESQNGLVKYMPITDPPFFTSRFMPMNPMPTMPMRIIILSPV
jgi:hypothetical protein